jgi:hypothetical protein
MSIGFKEWAVICEALGSGRQSIILRKGGIHEGRAGFSFQHNEFFLLPTLFHEQVRKTKLPTDTALPAATPGVWTIRHFARAEWTALLTDWDAATRLDRFHVWSEDEIRNRFDYESAGLNLAFVRVFTLAEPWSFPDEAKYGGCRSWVTLPDPPADLKLLPVLDDETHLRRTAEIRAAVAGR